MCFYTDMNYRGENFCVSGNESLQSVGDRYNDKISSIRIFGRAEVTVYENSNFNGSRRTISQDVPTLGTWSDRITSFQVSGERQYEGQYGGSSRAQYGGQGSGSEPRQGACFYKDANYRGENFCVSGNESMQSVGDRYNDTISSVRIFGRSEVTVYENSNFNGSRQTISQDVPSLGNWSDRITSFQVTGGRQYQGQYGGQGSGYEPRNGVCFYTDANYRGENFCVSGDESRQSVEDRYNDTISSIRIFGRAEVTVYENSNYYGSRRTFSQDVPNLANWSDRITSFQATGERQYQGQYGGQGSGNETRNGVCFYKDANYRGENFCVSGNESMQSVGDRYNDTISSVRIFGRSEVTVYENSNFNGSRQTISQDVPSLGNWSDRITSFQVTRGRQNQGQYGSQGSGNEPRNGACFYRDADYRGEKFCLSAGESPQRVENRFNEAISSVQVFGRVRVVVHEHESFGGASRTITGDAPHLGDFNDQITSIEVR